VTISLEQQALLRGLSASVWPDASPLSHLAYVASLGLVGFAINFWPDEKLRVEIEDEGLIYIINDENNESLGEHCTNTFVRQFIAQADIGYIHSWSTDPDFYGQVLQTILGQGKDAVFVHTTPGRRQDWTDFLRSVNPKMDIRVVKSPRSRR
jgi:hypothetical protein